MPRRQRTQRADPHPGPGQRVDKLRVPLAWVDESHHRDIRRHPTAAPLSCRVGSVRERGREGKGHDLRVDGAAPLAAALAPEEPRFVLGVHPQHIRALGEVHVGGGAALVAGGALLRLRHVVDGHAERAGFRELVHQLHGGLRVRAEEMVGEGHVHRIAGFAGAPPAVHCVSEFLPCGEAVDGHGLPSGEVAQGSDEAQAVFGHAVLIGPDEHVVHRPLPLVIHEG